MEHNWVFGGSLFWTDERTGKRYYSANGGDLICVSNFPSAMLDLPVESSQSEGELMFETFTENIPPLGTPVTIVLKPKVEKKDGAQKEVKKAEDEKKQPGLLVIEFPWLHSAFGRFKRPRRGSSGPARRARRSTGGACRDGTATTW
jgi:hypothetical protein